MTIKSIQVLSITFILLSVLVNYSCQDDNVSMASEIPLSFSVDTLRFDTVFTQAGSATRSFKIYNELDDPVLLNSVRLANASSSFFRINVDGFSQNEVEDVRIEAGDSIYVFAEVTIDPDNPLSISPFFIEEALLIQANNSSYSVQLEAWGQNANYIPDRESQGRVSYFSCDLGQWVWDDPRPYVLYGVLVIDSCELVLPPGTEVYVHGGVAINELGVFNDGLLAILGNGNIRAQGTLEEPVLFKTDRLEEEFDELQGQWSGILLSRNSRGNTITHTRIENAIVGLSVDSSASVRIESSTIAYTGGSGISASHASIYAENSLFYQNAGSGISLNYGGNYVFNYCTIANFNNQDPALQANNIRCLNSDCSQAAFNDLNCNFTNCIFMGNDRDEISFLDAFAGAEPGAFQYNFEHCIVRIDELLDANAYPNFFNNCVNCKNIDTSDTLFVSVSDNDFRLDTMSIAIDMGVDLPFVDRDILDFPREAGSPDIGCYEFQK